jgi:hypothetical protein
MPGIRLEAPNPHCTAGPGDDGHVFDVSDKRNPHMIAVLPVPREDASCKHFGNRRGLRHPLNAALQRTGAVPPDGYDVYVFQ